MKSLIVLALMTVSFSSHALVLARLTNTDCISADGQNSITMKHDSSISVVGPVLIQVNGQTVSDIIMRGNEFRVQAGDSLVKFEMKDAKDFVTTMTIAKLSEEDKEALENEQGGYFDFGGEEVQVDCRVNTKFRLRK